MLLDLFTIMSDRSSVVVVITRTDVLSHCLSPLGAVLAVYEADEDSKEQNDCYGSPHSYSCHFSF